MKPDFSVGEIELSYRPNKIRTDKVFSSTDAYRIMRQTYSDDKIQYREYFKAMFLNNANEVIGYTTISEGGLTECPVDLRIIYQAALLCNASKLILVHNHPSGNIKPSVQDKNTTRQITEAGRILRISVLDHLIITDNTYYSFNDEGIL